MKTTGEFAAGVAHPLAALAKETPLGAFSITMGLAGLGLAWRHAGEIWRTSLPVDEFLLALATFVFFVTLVLILFRLLIQFDSVLEELFDVRRSSTAATLPMALMLLSGAALAYSPPVANLIWSTALTVHSALIVFLLGTWANTGRGDAASLNDVGPEWLLPTGGLMLLPHAGIPLGHIGISWVVFLVGLVLWILAFGAVLLRLLIGRPLRRSLRPRFVIAMAPPALAFVSLVQFDGMVVSNWSSVTFAGGVLTAAVLLLFVHKFATYPFTTVWWSYTFPIAAFASACLLNHRMVGVDASAALAILALAAATVVIVGISIRSLIALYAGLRRR